jgi:hypothetical protein
LESFDADTVVDTVAVAFNVLLIAIVILILINILLLG